MPGANVASARGLTPSSRSGGRASYRRRALAPAGLVLIVLTAIAVPLILNDRGLTAGLAAASPTGAASSPAAAVSSVSAGTSATPAVRPSGPVAPSSHSAEPGQTTTAGTKTGEPGIVADRITITRLGIDLPIVEGDGIDAPLGKAAHFPGTGWPGSGSNIYLYGHARAGSFIDLWKAQVGDEVVLHLVDGSQRIYNVSKVIPKVAWNDMSVVAPTPAEQLSLQTCTSYQESAPRFLVIAVPGT